MEENVKTLLKIKEEKIKKSFERNQIQCDFMTREELNDYLKTVLCDNKKVCVGGSVTLNQLGLLDLIRKSPVQFLDRYQKGLSRDEVEDIFRQSFFADIMLTSTNAFTMDGCLYNIDGTGNRVAQMIYGPKKVIVIAGINKLCVDEQAAIAHIKEFSAPANAIRLHRNTPCAIGGSCQNCLSQDRICSSYVKMAYQTKKNRVHLIVLSEQLGY